MKINTQKNDIYALGLTMLQMCLLEKSDFIVRLNNWEKGE